MKRIFKYEITITDEQSIGLPTGAKILHSGLDPNGMPCIWAEVEPDNPIEMRKILVKGTGHPFNEDEGMIINYIGTFNADPFVWHTYEVIL